MNIYKRNEYDTDYKSSSRWSEIEFFGNLEYIEDVKNDLDAIKRLIDTDFDNLSDEEFFKLISNFYTVYITKKDILDIMSKINGIEYNKFQKLNSRMTFKDGIEGHRKDFNWWEETYQVVYLVATASNLVLNPKYNYSKDEIKQMAKNKQIICFSKYPKAKGMNPKLPYSEENVSKINMLSLNINSKSISEFSLDYNGYFDFSLLIKDGSSFNEEVYKSVISTIRKKLTKKKVLKDCKEIILFLNENMNIINDVITNECYLDKNNEKKYLNLASELKEKQKTLLLSFNN